MFVPYDGIVMVDLMSPDLQPLTYQVGILRGNVKNRAAGQKCEEDEIQGHESALHGQLHASYGLLRIPKLVGETTSSGFVVCLGSLIRFVGLWFAGLYREG